MRQPARTRPSCRSGEGAHSSDGATHDEGLHGFGALVGVECFDVGHVPGYRVLQQDAVAAHEVAGIGGNLAGPARAKPLGE